MKLGIIAGTSEDDFNFISSKGLEFAEFCINVQKEDDKEIYKNVDEFIALSEDIKKYSVQYNVGVGSVGRWGSNRIDTNGKVIDIELDVSKKLIDVAHELGCSNFVCGVNYVDEISLYKNVTGAIEYFGSLVEYAKSKSVKISAYNCRWNNFVCSPQIWNLVLGEIPDLGIKFDATHSIYDSGDYLKEMAEWGHKFNHVHIKGAIVIDGQRFDDPPAGLDQINWGAFMSTLYAKKYDGGLSIEPHSSNWKDSLGAWGLDYTVDYMNKLIFKN